MRWNVQWTSAEIWLIKTREFFSHDKVENKLFSDRKQTVFPIVSIVLQLKIEVKSIGNEWGTKNKKTWKSSRIISPKTFLYTKELYHWIRHMLVSYFHITWHPVRISILFPLFLHLNDSNPNSGMIFFIKNSVSTRNSSFIFFF